MAKQESKKGGQMADKNTPAVQAQDDKPQYLKELEAKGPVKSADNFDSTDVAIPRIKLLQGLSEEISMFNTARPGNFWHTGNDLSLGESFDFVAVSRRKKYLLVAPIADGQGILARADDFVHWVPSHGLFTVKIPNRKEPVQWALKPTVAESGLDKWGSYNPDDLNSPPAATLFYEYLVLVPDHLDLGPVVMMLTRTQIKKTRKGLNDKIALHENAGRPMQALKFNARSTSEENHVGQSYYNYQFSSAGFVPEELYKKALEMKDVLATYKVRDEAKAAGEDSGSTTESKDF